MPHPCLSLHPQLAVWPWARSCGLWASASSKDPPGPAVLLAESVSTAPILPPGSVSYDFEQAKSGRHWDCF